ncbi:MAG: glycyl-radical enzyme activating protein [Candidatus Zixiibacteriota bacterium]
MYKTALVFDIKKFAVHDGPGIRTTVFFKGCPLNCWWCHNPESRKINIELLTANGTNGSKCKSEKVGYEITHERLYSEIQKDIIFYDQSGGGVTFSGGEPMLQAEFLVGILKLCRENCISTYVDTSGYVPFSEFEKIMHLTDCFLYDIKLMDDELHQKYVGVSNQLILENLEKLCQNNRNIRIRVPLIPGITDTETNLKAIAKYIADLIKIKNIDILPYNIFGGNKYRKFNIDNKLGKLETQTNGQLSEMAEIFRLSGFNIKIGG